MKLTQNMAVLSVIEAYMSDNDANKTIIMNFTTANYERNLIYNIVTWIIKLSSEKFVIITEMCSALLTLTER
jgi:hypothetical protein